MNISRVNKGRREGSKKGYHKGCFGNPQSSHYTAEEMRQMKPKKTGRGNKADDHQLVMDYLRKIHPETARKVDIARATGIDQARVLIILNNLSGVSGDNNEDAEFIPQDFLVYDEEDSGVMCYGIYTDVKSGIRQGVKI